MERSNMGFKIVILAFDLQIRVANFKDAKITEILF